MTHAITRRGRLVASLLGLSIAAAPIPADAHTSKSEGKAENSGGLTDADFAKALRAVQKQIPRGRGFSTLIEKPFIVVGDGGRASVKRWATGTIRWAVQKLKARYFVSDPDVVLTVWLFKDTASYERHCREIFGRAPFTPYGYYSRSERALVMNIATGGGTLVHEIVHPFVERNFPEAPAWFNEGLGSLYEQSAERNGDIVGLTNWRLAGLQQAIRAGSLPSFHRLMHTTDVDFYDADPGTNYAQARYLLYYLQQTDRLTRYYRTFHARRTSDPSGYQSLADVLGTSDIAAFQARWEAWVLGLSFRPG